MRSVKVVLPESMCAEMPMFLIFSSGRGPAVVQYHAAGRAHCTQKVRTLLFSLFIYSFFDMFSMKQFCSILSLYSDIYFSIISSSCLSFHKLFSTQDVNFFGLWTPFLEHLIIVIVPTTGESCCQESTTRM